jgi:hypothetical protein
MVYQDRDGTLARMEHERRLADSKEWRLAQLARPARPAQPTLVRRGARLIGHTFVLLGVRLLRYGQSEGALLIERHRPGTPSATLN